MSRPYQLQKPTVNSKPVFLIKFILIKLPLILTLQNPYTQTKNKIGPSKNSCGTPHFTTPSPLLFGPNLTG